MSSPLPMSDQAQKSWCWWSTHESIANEVPSVTAILETIAAVVVYWWIALKVGVVWPLLVSAAVAPMVLLRSEPSIALGLKLFLSVSSYLKKQEDHLSVALIIMYPFIYSPTAIAIRIYATFLHLKDGIQALPRNFRRLVICTSPAQISEILPGIETTDSEFRFSAISKEIKEEISNHHITGGVALVAFFVFAVLFVFLLFSLLYLPAWLYRITIKSTAWFWWPLAFLGDDLKKAQNRELLRWKVLGSLWAKVSIVLASLSLLAFVVAHFHSLALGNSELLVPVERLLLIDWKSLWSWQVCALLGSVLSLAIVFLLNDVNGEYEIAQKINDDKLIKSAQNKLGWIERLSRFRFLVLLAFWGLVGTHMVLYVNSQQCWFALSPNLQKLAQDIYGDRLPRSKECPGDPSPFDAR
jgi:hypothetical protein